MGKLLTVIVLTKNEEQHLQRLIDSFSGLQVDFCIVDSYSNDRTLEIARNAGAQIAQNPFINHAVQFQWALDHCRIESPWVMRMDADEYLTPELAKEIENKLPGLGDNIGGVVIKRRVYFMGKWIRHGGYYPIKLLRIWRHGTAKIEQRWMDEHIVLTKGGTIDFDNDVVDDNLNNLTWWTDKHNHYATREAVDLLNREYAFMGPESQHGNIGMENRRKRWYKDNLYVRAPLFLRVFLYFMYRYIFLLGFLDGRQGLVWHFLQGCWYRFLVDAKILQIKWWSKKEGLTIPEIIEKKYNFKIGN